MDTLNYFIFSSAVYTQISGSSYSCNESTPTIAYVTSCPKNKTEWDAFAQKKNCESMAAHQNCTSADKFQYHCLENQWQNLTLEICAPIYFLQGFCPKYNTDKKQVEENYAKGYECLTFTNGEKCPLRYQSSDAYKYQRCYKRNRQSPTQTTDSHRYNNDDHIKTGFLIFLALALACAVVYILWSKWNYLKRFCKTGQDVEEGSNAKRGNENEAELGLPLLPEETVSDQPDSSKSNDGHSLKPVSNENITSKSISIEAPNSRPVSNGKAAADTVSASHTPYTSGFSFKSTQKETKKVVKDDPPLSKALPRGTSAESPESLSFDKPSSSMSNKNTFGSKVPDNSVTSFDKIFQNGTDAPKPILQYPSAAKSTSKDVPASDDAHVSTSSTDDPVLDNGTTSKPMSGNNPFDEDTTPSGGDPAPNDTTALEPMSRNNPFDEVTTPSDAGGNTTPNDSTALNPFSRNNPFDEDIPRLEFGKCKKARRPPPQVPKINLPQNVSLKLLSNEENASKSPSLEAPDSRPVSNGKPTADPVSASHTSSNSGFSFNSYKKETKKVIRDDPPVSKAIPTPAESPESIPIDKSSSSSFDKSSSSLSKKNTSGSKAQENSVTSSDKISQNGTDASNPSLHYPAATNSTLKDLSATDALVSTLSTDDPAQGKSQTSKATSENNPFDENTKPSALLDGDSASNETNALEPMSGNNQFDEDIPPTDAGSNPTNNTDSKQSSGSNPFDEDITRSEFGKSKRPRPPPHVTKINVPQNAPLEKKKAPPPPPQQPRKS